MAATQPTIISIASLYSVCIRSFDHLCHLLENHGAEFSDQLSLLALQDELGRFRVWAGNVGAHRTGRVSLDHKLRESSGIHATVADLIKELDGSLREVISIVSHERQPAEEWPSDSSDSSLDDRSGSESEEATTSTTELEERFLEVTHIITCLYRLSIVIQNPASRDRLERCASIEVGHFEYFDVAHASHKFPLTAQYLIDRLGNANTKRRQLLQYHQQHHNKLAMYINAPADHEFDQQHTLAADVATPDGGALGVDGDPAVRIDRPTTDLFGIAKTVNTQTTVSTFVERPSWAIGGSDAGRSQTSYATSVGADANTKLHIPPPPEHARAFDGEPFQCLYCFSMTAVKDSRSWMKHVFRDLRPYICTFQDCPKPDRLFQSRHDWFDHEVEVHRREWFCNACGDVFPTSADFMHHLSESHPEIDPGMQSEAVADRCERAIQSVQLCPMCKVEYLPRRLKSHLARHMQQLAIFVLPKQSEIDDDGEDGDEERTTDSILGSFDSSLGRTRLEPHLHSISNTDDDRGNDLDDIPSFTEAILAPLAPISDGEVRSENLTSPSELNLDHLRIQGPPLSPIAGSVYGAEGNRHQIPDRDTNNEALGVESGGKTGEIKQPPSHIVFGEGDAPPDSFSVFQRFIMERPELREFYKNKAAFAAHSAADVMIKQLCIDGCSMEIARDLVLLSLYDIAILIDDCDDMEAIRDPLTKTLQAICSVTYITHPRGISTIQFSSNFFNVKNVMPSTIKRLVARMMRYDPGEMAGARRNLLADDFVATLTHKKPVLVIVIACRTLVGEAQKKLENFISEVYQRRPRAVVFQLISVVPGSDLGELYRALKTHPDRKLAADYLPASYDLANIFNREEKWDMGFKICLGAILPYYSHAGDIHGNTSSRYA